MISCRYVGSETSLIADTEYDTVGQSAVFDEQGFRDAMLGGAAFITDDEFVRLGFSESELKTHGPSGSRFDPPSTFCEKLARGQQVFRDVRQQMLS